MLYIRSKIATKRPVFTPTYRFATPYDSLRIYDLNRLITLILSELESIRQFPVYPDLLVFHEMWQILPQVLIELLRIEPILLAEPISLRHDIRSLYLLAGKPRRYYLPE